MNLKKVYKHQTRRSQLKGHFVLSKSNIVHDVYTGVIFNINAIKWYQ